MLDLGCGFGRHAYEAARLGAHVVACDLAAVELAQVRATLAAMDEAGEEYHGSCQAVRGDATRLPFPDESFDRVIASEVLEHVDSDQAALGELTRVLRPGGVLAVTVPTWFPEKVCWALSDEYHAPKAVGGHVRIYRRGDLRRRLRRAGLTPFFGHHAHALHSPYWWLRCAVGPNRDDHRLVAAYRRLLEWDIVRQPKITRIAERVLSPVLGKSLVLYSRKPGSTRPGETEHVAA